MTAQIGEKITYEGQVATMCSEPLNSYFELAGLSPYFVETCTALWRGYVGSWEILDGRLYLTDLEGTLRDGSRATVATFFPDYPDRVFAHWYSGTLRVPQGKLLNYIHGGYGSTYEEDLLLSIEKGVVTGTDVRHNGTSDDPDAAEGYRISVMTVFTNDASEKGGGA